MRHIITINALLAGLMACLIAGCSGSSSPAIPTDSSRSAEYFCYCTTAFDGTPEEPFRDFDLATLIEKGQTPASCRPAILMHGGANHSFTIVVSLHQTPFQGKMPMYTWFKDGGEAACPPIMFGFPSGGTVDYKFPKVDAYFEPADDTIQVAVSFMWRLTQAPWPQNTWNIGVIFLHWRTIQFALDPIPPPYQTFVVLYPTPVTEWGHDIAFNHYTGEAYLVFAQDRQIPCPYRLRYTVLSEDPDPDVFAWTDTGFYWAVAPNVIGNMWLPSIDVGMLNMHEHSSYPDQALIYVGVAFTLDPPDPAPPEPATPFCVAYNYWVPELDGYGDQTANTEVIDNPYVADGLDAGLPRLDIAPNNSVPPYFALAFVQEENNPDTTWEYFVWLFDSRNWDLRKMPSYDGEIRQLTLPSVACHYIGIGSPEVSVSAYENEAIGVPVGDYRPIAWRFNVGPEIFDNPQMVQGPYQGIYGPWHSLDVAFMDCGVATGIVLTENNSYYFGFADSITTDWNPTTVYVAWGNTTQ